MSTVRFRILSEALKLVPKHGFSNTTYICALKNLDIKPNSVGELWERGFPVALAEYIVKSSTNAVYRKLEAEYSKNALVSNIVSNIDQFIENELVVPRASDIVEEALYTKIKFLSPFVGKWHEGIKYELFPSNFPYAVINLAEFADLTSFYVERLENMVKVFESARSVLAYKIKANAFDQRKDEIENFLRSFLAGLPLSSGPHIGGFFGQVNWSLMRGKIATLYCLSVASLMGDNSTNFTDTNSLVKSATKKLF